MAREDLASQRLSFPPALATKLLHAPCKIVVTGGGGWIGQATLEMLESALGDAIDERVSIFGSSNRNLQLRSGRVLPCRVLPEIDSIDASAKLFIHYAFLTKDRLLDQSVESFIAANQAISDSVVAAIEQSDTRGIFALSSGAVYKKGTHVLDDDLQANAYGVMKMVDEKRFAELAAKKKIPFCMPRLFNLSGPFINKLDLYALSSMIKAVLEGKPIVIRAAHRVVRSYIHVADLVTLAFAMLLEPQDNDQSIFDTAGENALDLGDLADHIRKALGHSECLIERPAIVEGRDDVYVGDGQAMRRIMQQRNLILRDLPQQIRDTADYMQKLPILSGSSEG